MAYSFNGRNFDRDSAKQYAMVIYLPERLNRIVKPLRERFDPDYDLIPAHVTLVFPWESAAPPAELAAVLNETVGRVAPFTIHLKSIGDFYPGTPVIYWSVQVDEQLNHLYRELHARLDQPLPFKELVPHVTVAKEISLHRVVFAKDQIASYLPDDSFEVKALDLVSPVADLNWVSVRTFPLGAK